MSNLQIIEKLKEKIAALEELQDQQEEGSPDWDSLENEQCELETALVRLKRGTDLGAYQYIIDTLVVEKTEVLQ